MKTLIYVERHGESVANINGIVLGHVDLDLTEKGFVQVKTTAETLANVDFSCIYSSDLLRAIHTAQPHSRIHNLPIITTKLLRELYFGDWENACADELSEKCPDEFCIKWRKNFGDFTPPNGENVQHMAQRMYDKIVSIAKAHMGTNILVTTHAAAIRALFGKVKEIAPENVGSELPFPCNASYSVLEFDGEKLKFVSYSNDEHLANCKPIVPV